MIDISNAVRIVLKNGISKKNNKPYYCIGFNINGFYYNIGFISENAYNSLISKIDVE